MSKYFGFLDAQTEQIVSYGHFTISDRSLCERLSHQTRQSSVTQRSLAHIIIAHKLIHSLDDSTTSRIFTAFLYGSTVRGAATDNERLHEQRLCVGTHYRGSLFYRSPLYSDLDLGIISTDVESVQKELSARVSTAEFSGGHLLEKPILWGVRIYPKEDIVRLIKTSHLSLVRRILASDVICLYARHNLRLLAEEALQHHREADELFVKEKGKLETLAVTLIEKYGAILVTSDLLEKYVPDLYPDGRPINDRPDDSIAYHLHFPPRMSSELTFVTRSENELSEFLGNIQPKNISKDDLLEFAR